MFDNINQNELFLNNAHYKKLVIFQSRFKTKECYSNTPSIQSYITTNNLSTCSDPDKISYDSFGTNNIFSADASASYTTKTYNLGGRSYQIGKGFYADLDWSCSGKCGTDLLDTFQTEYTDKGWIDNQTNYIAFIFNLYNPSFNTVMYWMVIYDNRYGWSNLSDIRSDAGIHKQDKYDGNYNIIGI